MSIIKKQKPRGRWADPATPEWHPHYYLVRCQGNKQRWIALKTGDKQEAKRRASVAWEAFLKLQFQDDRTGPAGLLIPPSRRATVGEVIDRYLLAPIRASDAVKAGNVRALRRVVKIGLNLNYQQDPDMVSMERLDGDLVRRWQAIRQGLPQVDFATRRAANLSVNSELGHARAIFAARYLDRIYTGLDLGTGFRKLLSAESLPGTCQDWQPWPPALFAQMTVAADALRVSDPDLWICNQLFRRFGLRRAEVIAAHESWLRNDARGQLCLCVEDDPANGFFIKGHAPRKLPVSYEMALELTCRKGFLLPGGRQERQQLLARHTEFLRSVIGAEIQKPNHELRKYVGSLVWVKHGAEMARWFLGHKDIQTTQSHYNACLVSLPIVDDELEELAKRVS